MQKPSRLKIATLAMALAAFMSSTVSFAGPYDLSGWNICSKDKSDAWFLHVNAIDKNHAAIQLCTVPLYDRGQLDAYAGVMTNQNCQKLATIDLKEFRRARNVKELEGALVATGDAALIVGGIAGAIYSGYAVFGVMIDAAGTTASSLGLATVGKVAVYTIFGYAGVRLGLEVASAVSTFADKAEKTAERHMNPATFDDKANEYGSVVKNDWHRPFGCEAHVDPSMFKKTALKGLTARTSELKAADLAREADDLKQIAQPAPAAPAPTVASAQANAS